MANKMGIQLKQWETLFSFGSKITADGDCSHEIKWCLLLGRKVMTNPDSILKSRDITLPEKVHLSSQSYGFSNSHVWMWELEYKESWMPKNWCFWNVVLENILESPLVHPKGNQSWIFIGRTDAEAPIFWPPDVKSDSLEKTLMLGKIEGGRRRGRQDEMVGWHQWLSGHEFE